MLIDIWRGRDGRRQPDRRGHGRAGPQLNGDLPLSVALTVRAAVAAYAGDEQTVRRDVADALAASQRCGSRRLGEWPVTMLGFLELSLGNYEAAMETVAPLMPMLEVFPDSTEIINASYVPDAAEALIHLGRLAEAEPLVALLERNGDRLDRPWMKAVGARCRAMLLAAQGDVHGANRAAKLALIEHDRLPMPFERARTQLLAGQLLAQTAPKGPGRNDSAGSAQDIRGSQRPAVGRPGPRRTRPRRRRHPTMSRLSPSEQRVAELAASGMTNRDVASRHCSSARRPSSRTWPASTASSASIHAPNSEGTWASPTAARGQGLRTQS